MSVVSLEQLVEIGSQMFSTKLFFTAVHFLWVYDYFLTIEDEIEYAWNGRRSWVFMLFLGNRYSVLFLIIWSEVLLHSYTVPFCQHVKWVTFAYSIMIVNFANITIALRTYAVSGRSRWVGGALSSMIVAQLACGAYFTVSAARSQVLLLPDINLDPFRTCAYEPTKFVELFILNFGIVFDTFGFLIIFIASKKPRYPGMPSILDTILRDATRYFVLMFSCLILSDLFVIFAPTSFSHAPEVATTIVIPLLASRLMLSLKKASMEPKRAWSLSTMSTAGAGPLEERTLHFASQVHGGLYHAPANPAPSTSAQEDVELQSVRRL